MASSNVLDNADKKSKNRRNMVRGRSAQRNKNNGTEEKLSMFSRSLSIGPSSEKKILNVESNYDAFFNVSQAFENILNELQIDDNFTEVYEKLLNIQSLVYNKLLSFEPRIRKTSSRPKFNLSNSNSNISESSLCSDVSEINCSDDESFMNKFLITVDCPFCNKSLADKINLIKHLDENCEPHLNKKFNKSKQIPFSVFQILPNNSFKCNICPNSVQHNIKRYISHLNKGNHVSALAKAAKTKYYSEYLFCSCCKVQVPNNYTQINFHINHEVHNSRSETSPNVENYLLKGIHCVYNRKKRFKCLDCHQSRSSYDTFKDILQHLEEPQHTNKSNQKLMIYCEFCSKKVHIFEVMVHFNESKHKQNVEEADKVGAFELCFYCGFVCHDLMSLSSHMKTKCDVINDIREMNLKSEQLEETNLRETESADDAKGDYIIVKGSADLPKLFKHFSKFGQIITIEMHNEKDVKIQFKEKNTVEDILLLKNVLKVDGVKLEVTTDENRTESDKSINKSDETIKSCDGNKKTNDDSDNDRDSVIDSYELIRRNNELQFLFQRVSSHLLNNTQKLESESQKEIVKDCAKTFEVTGCDLVGFMGLGLSFPVESISFYCPKSMDDNMLRSFILKMVDSELWNNVILCFDNFFPQITCTHTKTNKTCTVTFSKSAMMLTNMLRDCLVNDVIRSFCLIIRFWLSVHELKIRDFEYIVISIIVYFLVSEEIVNVSLRNKYSNPKINLLETAIEEKKYKSSRSLLHLDAKELFQRFLLFLNKFDFENYAICLPIQYPVPKSVFLNRNVKFMLGLPDGDRLVECSMCILDPVLLTNMAEGVSEEDKNSLLKVVTSTVKHYNFQ